MPEVKRCLKNSNQWYKNAQLRKFCSIAFWLLTGLSIAGRQPVAAQTLAQKYSFEVAGIRIGTMTYVESRTPGALLYEQISDVEFWFFGKIKIYYKTLSRLHPTTGHLLHSTTDATTSRGNFKSAIVWKDDHYEIDVTQYKYSRKAVERQPIDFTVSQLYFKEPVGRTRVFSEYFGAYATVEPTKRGSYRVVINDREDEYFYERGSLLKIVKKNSVKNYIVKREL